MLDFRGKTKAEAVTVMKRLWLRQLAFALLLWGVGLLFLPSDAGLALFVGLGWGLFDDALVLGSTVTGYGVPPEGLRKILLRFFVYRFFTGIGVIFVMLGLGLRVLETFAGFILLHIFFIFNLQNFTRSGK